MPFARLRLALAVLGFLPGSASALTLYTVTYDYGTSGYRLYAMDATSGAETLVGALSGAVDALAWDPTSQELRAIGSDYAICCPPVYSMHTVDTGDASLSTSLLDFTGIGDRGPVEMAFTPSGQEWIGWWRWSGGRGGGIGIFTNHSINAAASDYVTSGSGLSVAGLDNGNLLVTSYGRLWELDPFTNTATSAINLTDDTACTSPAVRSIEAAPGTGSAYALLLCTTGSLYMSGIQRLVRIDVATGNLTTIRNFVNNPMPNSEYLLGPLGLVSVPEPGSALMAGAALVALLGAARRVRRSEWNTF